MSQFVENFKPTRLMLVHGTGDGECLSCVWTVLLTEQLVCGRENVLAVQFQATPLKNNLGIYIYICMYIYRERERCKKKKALFFDKRT